ncbi:MAG: septum site-determining protein MinC [Lachnospiraceae bacterium]|jgi:septum site-determining protein MinC|nr:septum site-determining protein MinC [Lachnospiraceae bacterium]
MSQTVVIKGNRYGISVFLDPQEEFDVLLKETGRKFKESAKFFKNARMALSLEGKRLSAEQQRQMVDIISENGNLEILCLLGRDEEEERRYRAAIELQLEKEKANVGRFYKGTLRSGQVLESEGSVVILGDVNPGAKVIAIGNVIVLGALKGTACAGITGNEKSFVAALEMEPTQLRIGNVLGRGEDTKAKRKGPAKPKIAFCKADGIYVEELCRDILHDIPLG